MSITTNWTTPAALIEQARDRIGDAADGAANMLGASAVNAGPLRLSVRGVELDAKKAGDVARRVAGQVTAAAVGASGDVWRRRRGGINRIATGQRRTVQAQVAPPTPAPSPSVIEVVQAEPAPAPGYVIVMPETPSQAAPEPPPVCPPCQTCPPAQSSGWGWLEFIAGAVVGAAALKVIE